MEAEAPVLEYGDKLMRMLERFAEACRGDYGAKRPFTRRSFEQMSAVLALWVDGSPPFWAKDSMVVKSANVVVPADWDTASAWLQEDQ